MSARRLWIALAAVVLLGLATAAVSAEGSAGGAAASSSFTRPGNCGVRYHRRADIRHVIVIVFENHSYGQVIGHAPYFTELARACGIATNYHAITHPSLPNYFAMTSGLTHVTSDCTPQQCPISTGSIFHLVQDRHLIWQSFDESMPHDCSVAATPLYAPRHNPAVYYRDLHSRCMGGHDVRLGTPAAGPLHAVLHGTLGGYVFITPNLCHDMHDCPVAAGNAWLAEWMPAIRRSPVYQAGHTAVLITFDEGSGDQHVPLIVVSPYIHPGTRVTRYFNHYSLLRASEYAIGLHLYLGHAADPRVGGLGVAFRLR